MESLVLKEPWREKQGIISLG